MSSKTSSSSRDYDLDFFSFHCTVTGNFIGSLRLLKDDHAASYMCNTTFNSISLLLWFLLLDGGKASKILCLALKFLKSCHMTLKVSLYKLTTPSQLYKATNGHSQSTPRNPSVLFSCSAPALSHGVLIQNNNTNPGLRFYIKH